MERHAQNRPPICGKLPTRNQCFEKCVQNCFSTGRAWTRGAQTSIRLVSRDSHASVQARHGATFLCNHIVGGRPMRKQKSKRREEMPRCFYFFLSAIRVILSCERRRLSIYMFRQNKILPVRSRKTYRKVMLVRSDGQCQRLLRWDRESRPRNLCPQTPTHRPFHRPAYA